MVAIYAIITSSTYGWGSVHTLGLLGLAVVLMVAFLVLESKISNPIMPLRILKLRTLTGSGVVRGLLIIGMFSTFFIGALYFEHVLGYSPVKTGLAFLPQALGMAGMSTGITAWLVGRFGNQRVMYPAMVLAAAGLFLFASAGTARGVLPAHLLRLPHDGHRRRRVLHAIAPDRHVRDPQRGRRAGLGRRQRVPADWRAPSAWPRSGRSPRTVPSRCVAAGHDAISALASGYQLALLIAACCVVLGLILGPILLRTKESPEEQRERIKENMANPEAHEHLVL